jgi:hypothetical protein
MNQNLGSGARDAGQIGTMSAATAAYDAYLSNYLNAQQSVKSSVESNKSKLLQDKISSQQDAQQTLLSQTDTINKALATEAENYANIINAPREYFQYLIESEAISPTTPGFEKFYNVTYVNGEPQYTIKSQDDLDALLYNYENGEVTGLSDAGKDFYNQMLYGTSGLPESFNAWLAGTNRDLYDWAYNTESTLGDGTNFMNAFNQIDLNDIVSKQSYSGDRSDWYNNKKFSEYDVGDLGYIEKYGDDNGSVSKFKGLNMLGQNKQNILDGKSEAFRLETISGDNQILVKIDKDDVVSDDVINAIVNAEGNVGDNEVHEYNNEFYLSLIGDDGKLVFKKLNVSSGKEKDILIDAIKNPEAHQEAYEASHAKKKAKEDAKKNASKPSSYDYSPK